MTISLGHIVQSCLGKEMNEELKLPIKALDVVLQESKTNLSILSMHLEHLIGKYSSESWDHTAIPLICNLYACYTSMIKYIEVDGQYKIEGDQVIIDAIELDVLSTLLTESRKMSKGIESHGLSMRIH